MTLFGIDVHTKYQAGLDVEAVAAEGFTWMTVKVSQGTGASWADEAERWMDRGDKAGMLTFAYHYLSTADPEAQAATALAAARGRSLMLDVEDGSGPVSNVRAFLTAAGRIGQRVPLVYFPHWYWEKIGSPSLEGLPPLVSSRYRTALGYASDIYSGVPDAWWEPYGGATVAVLQFSDRASVAGKKVDVNAYRGTREELAQLLGADPVAPRPPAARPVLRWGDVDKPGERAWVHELQKVLADWYPSLRLAVDGVYKDATASAVRHLQLAAHLAQVDGVAGPATYRALGMS